MNEFLDKLPSGLSHEKLVETFLLTIIDELKMLNAKSARLDDVLTGLLGEYNRDGVMYLRVAEMFESESADLHGRGHE
ncbi:hypothetical protein EKK58_02195 [Candidatus Dependentiae bacterium]|nr:MAG: hypothetical protein EKK58_02195 [Candidatus Dependentiae bacterium]